MLLLHTIQRVKFAHHRCKREPENHRKAAVSELEMQKSRRKVAVASLDGNSLSGGIEVVAVESDVSSWLWAYENLSAIDKERTTMYAGTE